MAKKGARVTISFLGLGEKVLGVRNIWNAGNGTLPRYASRFGRWVPSFNHRMLCETELLLHAEAALLREGNIVPRKILRRMSRELGISSVSDHMGEPWGRHHPAVVTQLFPGQALRLQSRGYDLGLVGPEGEPGFPRDGAVGRQGGALLPLG